MLYWWITIELHFKDKFFSSLLMSFYTPWKHIFWHVGIRWVNNFYAVAWKRAIKQLSRKPTNGVQFNFVDIFTPIPSYGKKLYVLLKCFGKCEGLDPFVLIVTFKKTAENIRKPLRFLIFSGGIEMLHWEQIV